MLVPVCIVLQLSVYPTSPSVVALDTDKIRLKNQALRSWEPILISVGFYLKSDFVILLKKKSTRFEEIRVYFDILYFVNTL